VENWQILNNILDLGTNSSRDHIDLCNATEIISKRQLGDLFEMTWRWVYNITDLYYIYAPMAMIMRHHSIAVAFVRRYGGYTPFQGFR
jgi:hypothetical protein